MPFKKGHPGYTPKLSEEHKQKISESHKGKRASVATRKKQSLAKVGKPSWNKGVKNPYPITDEHRRKLSEAKKGEKCHLWKGGITPENESIRKSVEYKLWREAVFQRDSYRCQWCSTKCGDGKSVKLNADHIKSFSKFKSLRFSLKNGRTLCESCHKERTKKQMKVMWSNQY